MRETCELDLGITVPNSDWIKRKTKSSWLNCALRDDEAMYWVSNEHYEAVAFRN